MRGISNLPYIGSQAQFEDFNLIPSLGGKVLQLTAGASLNVGDIVQIAGTNTVNKLTATPNRTIGIVVGGASMQDGGVFEPTGVVASDTALITAGLLAATVGQLVYVMVHGVFYAVCDATVIPNASQIKASTTTAGRITLAVSALTIAAGATPVTSSAANGAIIIGDDAVGQVIGKMLDVASTGAGDVRLVYLNIH